MKSTDELVQLNNPVDNPPFNNWSIYQPSPPHDTGLAGDEDLGLRDIIIDGMNGYDMVQLSEQVKNPVDNPPFNNWSVNQPSVPHDRGLKGKENLGLRDLTIDGVNGYHFVQTSSQVNNPVDNPPFNNWSVNQPSVPHDKGLRGKEDLHLRGITIDGVDGYAFAQTKSENPVDNPPFNNWSVNQPSVPHDKGLRGKEDLHLRGITIDGVDGYAFAQTKSENPVDNPPFNNWSVNQPSPPHDRGMAGKEDLGLTMVVRGHKISVAQNPVYNPPFNNWSVNQPSPPHDRGMQGKEDLGMDMIVNGHKVHIGQNCGPFQEGLKGDEDLGLDMRVSGDRVHVSQQNK